MDLAGKNLMASPTSESKMGEMKRTDTTMELLEAISRMQTASKCPEDK